MMMRNVYVVADNIYSPLGKTTRVNIDALKSGSTAVSQHATGFSPEPFYAALFSAEEKQSGANQQSETGTKSDQTLTFFEQIILASATDAIQQAQINTAAGKTGFILSTTKGNISLIEHVTGEIIPESRISLNSSADIISKKLGLSGEPLVVSHACISGLLAMITGMRLIQSGMYDTLIISGGDLITAFIYSGFKSFQAISSAPCRPFDAARDGISLGEAAATVILSSEKKPGAIRISGGSVSNDANHISGPSRTGEELWLAIRSVMQQAGVTADDIDFISAHGTATRYNDEMEAKAINLAAMQHVPTNSLKGYYGHTLGAAGIIESVVAIHSLKENFILPTKGFSNAGTEKPVNIIKELKEAKINTCLKTASGFGGCNAAIVLQS